MAARIALATGRRADHLLYQAEDVLAPLEYEALLHTPGLAADRLAGQLVKWQATVAQSGGVISPFLRQPVSVSATFYSDGGASDGKLLLVCFSGLRGRIGLATPLFLQCLDAAAMDVLLLADPAKTDYRAGVQGMATDMAGLVMAVATRFGAGHYQRLVALGNSKGALPALWFGQMAGAERSIAIGARPLPDALDLIRGVATFTAFDPLCICRTGGQLAGMIIHSEKHPVDRDHALVLARQIKALRVEVAGVRGHNLTDILWQTGDLPRFLAQILAQPAEAPGSIRRFSPSAPGRITTPLRRLSSLWQRLRRRFGAHQRGSG